MAIPKLVRPFTKHVVNPLTRLFAGRVPGFAMLTHTGRKSGRRYSIPLNMFRHDGEYVFALTYGSDTQWVQNVLASGMAEVRERGRTVRVREPRLVRPVKRVVPLPVAFFLRLTGVGEYLLMRPEDAPAA